MQIKNEINIKLFENRTVRPVWDNEQKKITTSMNAKSLRINKNN